MATFILATVVVALAMLGLSTGVLLGRRALRGSCGGVGCSGTCTTCPKRRSA